MTEMVVHAHTHTDWRHVNAQLHDLQLAVHAHTPAGLGWAGLGWAGLGWAGLGWAGLGWAGLGWAGLGCAGLGCAGLGWAGLGWAGLGCAGLGCAGLRWAGLGWAALGWAGLCLVPSAMLFSTKDQSQSMHAGTDQLLSLPTVYSNSEM